MAFLFVGLNDIPYLCIQPCMNSGQARCDILVHSRFGNAEYGCRAANRRAVLCNVAAEAQGARAEVLRVQTCRIKLLFLQFASLPMRAPRCGGILPTRPYAARPGFMHRVKIYNYRQIICIKSRFTCCCLIFYAGTVILRVTADALRTGIMTEKAGRFLRRMKG